MGAQVSTAALHPAAGRPETVKITGRQTRSGCAATGSTLQRGCWRVGRAIGQKSHKETVRWITSAAGNGPVNAGDVLVTYMTDPDWEPGL